MTAYCVNRVSSDTTQVVRLTIDFYKRNYIEELSLSSGVIQTPDYSVT